MAFSGSYEVDDVQFLLKPVAIAPTEVHEKERLIQSGRRHYSEMLSAESPPDETYLALFDGALARHRSRFAADIVRLARRLAERQAKHLALVSLARAGTPIGVLLRRTLQLLGHASTHYSISIIRDRGLDAVALDHIVKRHEPRDVVFIDGWTGKGAIAEELERSTEEYFRARGITLDCGLYVVADLAGRAAFAATADDYLIPCSILNATISGLVSRTVLNGDVVGPEDFHACAYYQEFAAIDRSRPFVDNMMRDIERCLASGAAEESSWSVDRRASLRQIAAAFVRDACLRYNLGDPHRIKPGIGEATRALLRRVPSHVMVRDPGAEDVAHLVWLANRRDVAIEVAPWMPYQAAAVIRTLGND